MKIRTDFVSNSSSSSFICAIDKNYNTQRFAVDLAQNCVNPKSEFYNQNLENKNYQTLTWCFNEYELLFLGSLSIDKKEYTVTKESVLESYKNGTKYSHVDIKDAIKEAEEEWRRRINLITYENKNCHESSLVSIYDASTETITYFDDITVSNVAVEKYIMNSITHHCKPEKVAEKIVNYTKWYKQGLDFGNLPYIETYSITLKTIENTRLLLQYKQPLDFASWEDVDEIEKRLKNGEKLFAVRIAQEGDGKDLYDIYKDYGANGIEKMNVDILHSECL